MVSPFGSAVAADALVLAYIGLVLGAAVWTHRRIETPSRQWSRRLAAQIRLGSARRTRLNVSLSAFSAATARLWGRA